MIYSPTTSFEIVDLSRWWEGVACREAHRSRRAEGRRWVVPAASHSSKQGKEVGCMSQGREMRQLWSGEDRKKR
jgi:hypothetical protein